LLSQYTVASSIAATAARPVMPSARRSTNWMRRFSFQAGLPPSQQLRRALTSNLRYLSRRLGLALRLVLGGRGADPEAWEVFEAAAGAPLARPGDARRGAHRGLFLRGCSDNADAHPRGKPSICVIGDSSHVVGAGKCIYCLSGSKGCAHHTNTHAGHSSRPFIALHRCTNRHGRLQRRPPPQLPCLSDAVANLGAADTTARCRAPDANYLPRFDPSVPGGRCPTQARCCGFRDPGCAPPRPN
jgi:hypothetical protein